VVLRVGERSRAAYVLAEGRLRFLVSPSHVAIVAIVEFAVSRDVDHLGMISRADHDPTPVHLAGEEVFRVRTEVEGISILHYPGQPVGPDGVRVCTLRLAAISHQVQDGLRRVLGVGTEVEFTDAGLRYIHMRGVTQGPG